MSISIPNILLCFAFLATSLHAQYASPKIECDVKNCLNPPINNAKPAVCDVSNGAEIQILIKLNTITYNPIVYPILNPSPIPSKGGEYFLLKILRESDGAEMPINIKKTGGGKDLNYTTMRLYLDIPETKESRRAKTDAAWTKWKAQHSEVNSGGVKDGDMVDALENDLVENQLGHFKIICSYTSDKNGTWNGQVTATPIRINVLNRGTSLDKLSHP